MPSCYEFLLQWRHCVSLVSPTRRRGTYLRLPVPLGMLLGI